ncbi:type VII secretion protein EccB [Krasilnikovia cinnamomea]|uniref:Type VII secretion protein EccB n=1 Tax=Krasilnikovia cinnamomea TaxID=349313 RepID=A0A4Q7ZQV2_9ACTN|nr:type VII secretion protein EccB [Krasilnikovia cinnamomea]RZU53500.1 type VII secretion protein EccB [Krasilnikovia cinnamomea]
MQTQRDHVHAHQFQMGRMSCALVLGDPDTAEHPSRRAWVGLLVGILVAVLVAAGFAGYGWLVPGGNKQWRAAGAIIVEKETGTRYVYLDGVLHPTLNLTSAMLIQGSRSRITLTSRNSLKGVPHGAPIGLPGAPQVLPTAQDLVRGPWLACLAGSVPGGPADGVGINLDPAAPFAALAGDRFTLVDGADSHYLVWRGRKHRITDQVVPVALGATNAEPARAPARWLDTLPDGDPIGVPEINGTGDGGPPVAGREYRVGQLFTQPSSGAEQLFVLRPDGLTAVSRTAFLLLKAGSRGDPVALEAADVVAAPRSGDRSLAGLLPDLDRARYDEPGDRVLCARQSPAGAQAVDTAVVFTDRAHSALRADGTPTVHARPGTGMVVLPVPVPPLQPLRDLCLVSDEGVRFRLPDNDTLSALRLAGTPPVPFPAELLTTVPEGPVLSRKAIATNRERVTS